MSNSQEVISTIDQEEEFLLDVQTAIYWLLKDKGFTQKKLADRMGISASAVSQFFDEDGKNLTLRTVAKVFSILGEQAEVTSDRLAEIKRDAIASAKESRQKAEGNWIGVHLDHAKTSNIWEHSTGRTAANNNNLKQVA